MGEVNKPAVVKVKFIVLWVDEIRAAAKALDRVRVVFDDDNSTDKERSDAARDAINVAAVAVYGAEDDDAVLVLSSQPPVVRNTPTRKRGR